MKNVFKKFLVFSAVISLAFTGCNDIVDVGSSNEENATAHVAGKAVLSLSVNQNSTRTIMPTNISEADVTQIELSATKSGADGTETAYSFSIDSETLSDSIQWLSDEDKTAIANMENSTITIDYGTYTFTLKLYTGEPSRLRLTQSAVLENVEITKETTSLAFEAKYVEKGDLSLTIQFDSDFDITKRIGTVKAGLFTMSSKGKTAVTGYDYEELSYSALTNEKAASYTKTGNDAVPNGTYYVKFQIYAPATGNEEVGELLNTISEIVKIHGYKTEKTINIASEYLNALYSVIYNLSNEKTAWKDGVEESLTTKRNIYTGITLPVEDDISCSGWKLLGWYEKDSDGNPIDADNDGETDLITTIGTGTETAKDYTLYAKWEKETVTTAEDTFSVSIKVDDSSDISATHTENNTSLTFTVTPPDSKAAYSYAWTVDGVAETPTSEPTFTVDGSDWATGIYEISLIATETKTDSESGETATNYYSYLAQIEWTRLYTVRFNITGAPSGTAEVEPQYVAENAETKMITAPADVTPTYGWYTDAEFTEEFDFTSEVTKSMTLYGCWKLTSIHVSATGSSDTGIGTESKPFASISSAIAKINEYASATTDYTIVISGELNEYVGLGVKWDQDSDDGNGIYREWIDDELTAKSITLTGATGSSTDILKPDSDRLGFDVLEIRTGVPVTITNLRITGGQTDIGINSDNAKVTLGEGCLVTDNGNSSGICLSAGSLILDGGSITANSCEYGGGVTVSGGEFIMKSGTIGGTSEEDANTADYRGAGVYVTGGIFTMQGGTICGNKTTNGGSGAGVYVGYNYDSETETYTTGTFIMEGGTISGNEAVTAGGGVFVDGSDSDLNDTVTFTMTGGTITGNKQTSTYDEGERGGGGVALYGEKAVFNMENGTISANEAACYGGGVSVVGSATFNMTGGTIGGTLSDNTSVGSGGAVYIGSSGTFDMTGGAVSGNTCGSSASGSGVYIRTYNGNSGTLKMGGSASIASDNDVYLSSGAVITITDQFDGDIQTAATITPSSYSTDTTVLVAGVDADNNPLVELENEYDVFAVTPQTNATTGGTINWYITKSGTMTDVDVTTVADKITSLTASATITLAGSMQNSDLATISTALGTLYTNNTAHDIMVTLDLSNVVGLTEILERAFEGKRNLAGIKLPEGVTSIGGYAFQNCTMLNSVTIPESVSTIGTFAFAFCIGLSSITLPDSVKTIGTFAFNGCTGLTTVNFGTAIETISVNAFQNCKLAEFTVAEDNQYFSAENGALFDKNKTKLVRYPTATDDYIVPSTVTELGGYAFQASTGITSVTLPEGVETIGSRAFANCTNLVSLEIPASVTTITPLAFEECSSLTTITVSADSESYSEENGTLFNKDKTALVCYYYLNYNSSSPTEYTIPNTVETIKERAFYKSKIKTLTIPVSVKTIEASAFDGTYTSVTMVNYKGSEDDRVAITISDTGNGKLTSATWVYNYTGN